MDPVVKRERIDVCIDTNVAIEMSTMVDIFRARDHEDSKCLADRRKRKRGSMALEWQLNHEKKRVVYMGHEIGNILDKKAPSGSPDATWPWLYAHFQLDYIFDKTLWTDLSALEESTVGDAVDRRLVRAAQEAGVPLISRETRQNGEIAKEARRCGVHVMTPEEYLESNGCSVDEASMGLLRDVEEKFPVFVLLKNGWPFVGHDSVFVENCSAYYEQLKDLLTEENSVLVRLGERSLRSRTTSATVERCRPGSSILRLP